MKRLLAITVAVALFGLGPVPLSLCAQLSSKAAECASPATESPCDRMEMAGDAVKMRSTPNTSCCDLSRAPVSERQQKASEIGLTAISQIVSDATGMVHVINQEISSRGEQDISPPRLQSILCTFLI